MGIFYLSFQRPPPLQVRPSEPVKVCITITNDLRSETYTHPFEKTQPLRLRVAWVVLSPSGSVVRLDEEGEVGADWRDGSCAFRVLEGLRAPSVRSVAVATMNDKDEKGQGKGTLHLGVYVGPSISVRQIAKKSSPQDGHPLVWPLLPSSAPGAEEADEFIPVLSGPIQLLADSSHHGQQAGSKQNELLRTIRLPGSLATPRNLIIQEETGYELDKHIWDASLHLLRLLTIPARIDSLPTSLRLLDRIASVAANEGRAFNVVELGAGTAVVSIALARWLEQNPPPPNQPTEVPARVTFNATDLDPALPIMDANSRWNDLVTTEDAEQSSPSTGLGDSIPPPDDSAYASSAPLPSPLHPAQPRITLQPLVLDWTQPLPSALPHEIDLIMVSDCTYNPTFYPALAQTILSLLTRSKASATCVLSKKHRHSDERGLWLILKGVGLDRRLVDGCEHQESDIGEEQGWGTWEIFPID
ncbi:hypothetical protein CF326_g5575 [Tilletia indica]|nr:hypothetical protein CF326_g5575 [Tilletia indica]